MERRKCRRSRPYQPMYQCRYQRRYQATPPEIDAPTRRANPRVDTPHPDEKSRRTRPDPPRAGGSNGALQLNLQISLENPGRSNSLFADDSAPPPTGCRKQAAHARHHRPHRMGGPSLGRETPCRIPEIRIERTIIARDRRRRLPRRHRRRLPAPRGARHRRRPLSSLDRSKLAAVEIVRGPAGMTEDAGREIRIRLQDDVLYGMADGDYRYPFANARLRYPKTSSPSVVREEMPLDALDRAFAAGIASGRLDYVILPIPAFLRSRRIDLLTPPSGLRLPNEEWCLDRRCRQRSQRGGTGDAA